MVDTNLTFKPPQSNLEGNELKDFVQSDIRKVSTNHQTIVVEAATGFGKTKTALGKIDEYPLDARILIIVPTINLKEQWLDQVDRIVDLFVINTATMNEAVIKDLRTTCWDLVIIDEVHKVLSENSVKFSTILSIITGRCEMLLSATLEKEHKAFLYDLRPNAVYYKISLAWCYNHNLIPEHYHLNIPVRLTEDEKIAMEAVQKEYDRFSKMFAKYDIRHCYVELDDYDASIFLPYNLGQIRGNLNKWKACTNARKEILQNASNKLAAIKFILDKYEKKEVYPKILIFAKRVLAIEDLEKVNKRVICYHSKHSDKEKRQRFAQYFLNMKPVLATINTIIAGFDMKAYADSLKLPGIVNTTCQIAIRTAYDSKALTTTQGIGRILRYNTDCPDQIAYMINLYVMDYEYNGKQYFSQEKKWLVSNLQDQINIKWITNLADLEL